MTRPLDATELAAKFELHDPAIQEHPYPLYRTLQAGCPVAWSGQHGGYWVITSHEIASQVFQDPGAFSNVQALIPNWEFPLGRQIPVEIDGEPHRLGVLELDLPLS
jgi:cytochrome P450